MKIQLYSDLNPEKIPQFAKFRKAIESDNFTQADVRKVGHNLYRACLNRTDRLIFALHSYAGQTYCLVLEFIANHAYDKSRFLKGTAKIEEDKLARLSYPEDVQPLPLTYVNPDNDRFNLLDKILCFDNEQQDIYQLPPPLVVIGSAGSGKTALILEKMKQARGDVLYVSLSSFLVQNARDLYYGHHYSNDDQQVDFLSFNEFLESLKVPHSKEITFKGFSHWFQRHRAGSQIKDPHQLFEEFRGVLTGPMTEAAWLSRTDYLALGVKQSIFNQAQRSQVYNLFERYLQYLKQSKLFDPNILSHEYQSLVSPSYDFVVVDEVQDITNIQLYLILLSLRQAGEFLLCGDSNQIVHPNFFSWAKIKTLFFKNVALTKNSEILRVLNANYRNSPIINQVANRILKLKHARFGSIDRESNFLITGTGERQGRVQLLQDSDEVKNDLDAKTARSTQFAILVMHADQKQQARRWFNTPLVFSIQEAKGLEYENIILFNFVSGENKVFREIAAGVDPSELEGKQLTYSRVKDKQDKSLEIYKFFINALYVAVTRAVHNLYLVESQQSHPIVELLGLTKFGGELSLEKQKSSLDDWQKEASKLALQGKQEQADDIRQRILQQQPVPWQVLDYKAFSTLKDQALAAKNNKSRLLAWEYALIYQHYPTQFALTEAGFKTASKNEGKSIRQLNRKHFMQYDLKHFSAVLRDVQHYGIDHRTVFNLTPLMIAVRLGNYALVETLTERGADKTLVGSNGLNALQMTLEQALIDHKYAQHKIARVFPLIELSSLSIQVDGRLIKLDSHLMGLFVLNVMFALFYHDMADQASVGKAFSADWLTKKLANLPSTVLADRRKKQSYISSILSGNEVDSANKYNRKLFLRLRRGHYIINPKLKLRLGNEWLAAYQLLGLDDIDITCRTTLRKAFLPISMPNSMPADYRRANLNRYNAEIARLERNLKEFRQVVRKLMNKVES